MLANSSDPNPDSRITPAAPASPPVQQQADSRSPLAQAAFSAEIRLSVTRSLTTSKLHEDLSLHGNPYILLGRRDRPTVVFYGGLAATGYPWQEVAREVNSLYGCRTEVYPLAGHSGSWRDLSRAGHEEWVNDITERARAANQDGMKPIFFGFSTSAAAAIEATARDPELFRALVLVAPPVNLRKLSYKIPLTILDTLDKYIPPLRGIFRKLTTGMPPLDTNEYTHELLNNPRFKKLPLTTFIALARLQQQVRGSLDKVKCPVLFVQGGEDGFIKLDAAEAVFNEIGSDDKEFVAYKDAPHAVMLSNDKKDLHSQIMAWLDRLMPEEHGGDGSDSARVRLRRSIRESASKIIRPSERRETDN